MSETFTLCCATHREQSTMSGRHDEGKKFLAAIVTVIPEIIKIRDVLEGYVECCMVGWVDSWWLEKHKSCELRVVSEYDKTFWETAVEVEQ